MSVGVESTPGFFAQGYRTTRDLTYDCHVKLPEFLELRISSTKNKAKAFVHFMAFGSGYKYTR